MRRIPPSWFLRMKSGSKTGFAVFMIAITIGGAIIGAASAMGVVVSKPVIFALSGICIMIGLAACYVRGRMKLLPDSFIDELSTDGKYLCEYCAVDKLREACEMTRPFYKHEYVDPDIAEQWRIKNSKAFVQIVNTDGILCACFGVLAPEPSFMDQFIKGLTKDTQLRAENICDFEDSKKRNSLYLSGVIIRDSSTYKGAKRARVMIWAILQYLKKLYGLRRKRLFYALAITTESERLMKNLGFQLHMTSKFRADKCDMYKYELTKQSWQQLMHKVGDCSHMCICML